MDYVSRMKEIYAAFVADDDIDVHDVAELSIAVLQEEAKDRRMQFIDERKDARVEQMRLGEGEKGGDDWRNDPATAAQKKALRNYGVDFSDDITKGAASDLIDEAKKQD